MAVELGYSGQAWYGPNILWQDAKGPGGKGPAHSRPYRSWERV